jgi:hypothetical protein
MKLFDIAGVENEHGFAMISALMLLLLTLTLGSATLLYTLLDVKSTQHYKTGNQAFAAGEAGVLDAVNTIETRGIVNFQNDVVNSGIVSTALTALAGFPQVTYQVTSLVSGANPVSDGTLAVTGNAPLSAQRVITVGLRRGVFSGGPGALHLSNDGALGTFSGNSMTIDGNNWNVTDITTNPPVANADPSVTVRPAISTRNDMVTTQVVTALAGQGTITGLGPPPSVFTTSAASTADLLRFVNDILAANGAPNGCTNTGGGKDYWLPGACGSGPPGPQCGVHCIRQTNGNANNSSDKWGTLAVPNVTYVYDTTAKITGGSSGAGILIFSGDAAFGGNFNFCGWVLFMNPSANGITIQGNPTIYGTVLTPLAAFTGGGSITIKYSQNCLVEADTAGINNGGNLPHPLQITSWAD